MLPPDLIEKTLSKTCRHGKNVYNKYTGEMMYQSCGKCDACLTRMASAKSIRVSLQASLSKYCYFVTLTYDTRFVPKARIYSNGNNHYAFVIKPRDKKFFTYKSKDGSIRQHPLSYDDDFRVDFTADDKYINDFVKQANLGMDGKYPSLSNWFGYLSRKDFQLFMKRLRKQIKLITDEKIHSFVVGEYSPKHFRPHFHFLLFFDSDKLAENIGRFVRSCWQFGRVDVSSSRGDAESYVAGYVNSFSCLPYHLGQNAKISPFSRFSNHFGERCFLDASEALRDSVSKSETPVLAPFLVGQPSLINGKLLLVRPPRSIIDSCFFRKASNGRLSSHELLYIVRAVHTEVSKGRKFFNSHERSFSYLNFARFLIESFSRLRLPDGTVDSLVKHDSTLLSLLYYARVDYLNPLIYATADSMESAACSIYRLVLQCERFFRFWRLDKLDYFTSIRVMDLSRHYFSTMTKNYLRERLQFLQDCPEDIADYYLHPTEFFADNLPVRLVSRMDEISHSRCRNAIKHRDINDLNIKYVKPVIFSKEYAESLRVCS